MVKAESGTFYIQSTNAVGGLPAIVQLLDQASTDRSTALGGGI